MPHCNINRCTDGVYLRGLCNPHFNMVAYKLQNKTLNEKEAKEYKDEIIH